MCNDSPTIFQKITVHRCAGINSVAGHHCEFHAEQKSARVWSQSEGEHSVARRGFPGRTEAAPSLAQPRRVFAQPFCWSKSKQRFCNASHRQHSAKHGNRQSGLIERNTLSAGRTHCKKYLPKTTGEQWRASCRSPTRRSWRTEHSLKEQLTESKFSFTTSKGL